MLEIEFKEIPINHINLIEDNPRTITDDDLQKLSDDIKKDPLFLEQRPPLLNEIDGEYFCYAGNQRVKAAKIAGYKKLKCFVQKNVPVEVQKERMVKDNLHRGKWDEDKLMELGFELPELVDFGLNDMSLGIFDNFNDMEMPTQLTADKKENPPSIKITCVDGKQLGYLENHIKELIEDPKYNGVTYSISQGEL